MARIPLPLVPGAVRWVLVAVVAGGIAVASTGPPVAGPAVVGPFGLFDADKWLHFLAYLALSGVLAYALVEFGTREADHRALAVVLLVAAGYGVAIEAVQFGLPARQFDIVDGLANAAGATAGAAVWRGLVGHVEFRRLPAGEE